MKSPVSVSIAGHRFTLRSDEDESVVREMAAHVDKHLRDLQSRLAPLTPNRSPS